MKSITNRHSPTETVPLTVKGRGIVWTPDLKLLLIRHLEKITARFPLALRAITASLEDVNGPRGGIDKRCRVNFMLKSHGQLSVCARSTKIESAINRATQRLRTVLRRKLQGMHFRS